MDVQAYFDRIGFQGRPRADLETLTTLHRLHLHAIPYENLDVLLGRPVSLEPEAAFEKLVLRRRGGWCYEMNGLLGAVLEDIGFSVTRMAGAVLREERGEVALGNHLVLKVDLDRPYIADVGFGDGVLEPIPLSFGPHNRRGYDFRLEEVGAGWLRFHNHAQGGAPYFDFRLEPAEPAQLRATSHWLANAPDSIFVQTALSFRHTPAGVTGLLGRTLRRIQPDQKSTELIDSTDEFVEILKREFGLDVPEAASLWPAICAKHDELFAEPASA